MRRYHSFLALLSIAVACAHGQSTSVPLVPEAGRSAHFAAVQKHLELGGVFYGYVDVDGEVEKLGKLLTNYAAELASSEPQAAMFKQDYTAILSMLGLTDVKAIGGSSVADRGGYRNHTFFYTPKGRSGLLAMVGGAPASFANARLAPEDTDLFVETELDIPAGFEAIRAVVARIGGDALVAMMENELKKKSAGVDATAYDVIQSLKGRFTYIVRLDPSEKLRIPAPNVPELPGIAILIRADGLGKVLEPVLAAQPMLPRTEEGGRVFYSSPMPLPGTQLQPLVSVDASGALLIATSRDFLVACVERKAGLDQNAAFKNALAAVGQQGNGLSYVTPRLFEQIQAVLDKATQANPDMKKAFTFWNLPKLTQPMVGVRINRPDGILMKSHSPESLKQSALLLSGNSPVLIGLVAAMAIPAFQKVKMSSQEKAIINNLRQLHTVGQMYMLETGKPSASYSDIVGDEPNKPIKKLRSVAGEDYSEIVIRGEEPIEVTTSAGKVIRYPKK